MSSPDIGRIAVAKIGSTAIGYATGFTAGVDSSLVKEYAIDGTGNPAIVKNGNYSYSISADHLFIDTTYLAYVTAKAALSFEVSPQGTSSGKPKITYNGVVLNKWSLTIANDKIVMEKVSGEGTSVTPGTN